MMEQKKNTLRERVRETEQRCGGQVMADRHRMEYHLMAPVGWLNDPNGLCQFRDTYHVFFQYAPFYPNDYLKCWGHYTSEDLVHFRYQGAPVLPDREFDRDGAYSGCAIGLGDRLYLFYTGNVKEEGEHDYVLSGRGANVIRMTSLDGIHFEDKRCILTNEDYPAECTCHVRDPKVYKGKDGAYHMVLGARLRGDRGAILLYRSQDLEHFIYEGMHMTEKDFGYMWECPDIFTLDGHRVLSVSPQGVASERYRYQNIYQSGYFVEGSETFTEWDMGFDFYAPQTFADAKGRQILIGWAGVPDAEYDSDPTQAGWNHSLTVPRELFYREGRICQYPVRELEALRRERLMPDEKGCVMLEQGCGDVLIHSVKEGTGSICIGTGCVLEFGQNEITLSFQDETGAGRGIRRAKSSPVQDLRILVDVSILEIYINGGEMVFTSRIFMPEKAVQIQMDLKAEDIAIYRMEGMVKE